MTNWVSPILPGSKPASRVILIGMRGVPPPAARGWMWATWVILAICLEAVFPTFLT